MHIAMLAIHSSPLALPGGKEAGGMNVYVRALSRELARSGHTVDVFTRRTDPAAPDHTEIAPGAVLHHIAAGPAAPYDKNRILDHLPALLDGIEAVRGQRPYDVIHSHYWVSGQVALALRERWHIPIVQMFHTLGALKNTVARGSEETETAARIAIERTLVAHVDGIIAATTIDREHLVTQYAAPHERVWVIPPGVDLEHFQPQARAAARAALGLPTNGSIVLGVGRMEPLKGFDILLEATALLRAQLAADEHSVRVLLVGGGSEAQPAHWNTEQRRLARLRETLALGATVQFVGSRPHHELPQWYSAADVFVMPSFYESFGMAALEAMACRTPVIASDVGGLRVLLQAGRGGVLVPPRNAAALAATMHRLLGVALLREQKASEAYEHARTYNWQAIASAVQSVYREVMAQS